MSDSDSARRLESVIEYDHDVQEVICPVATARALLVFARETRCIEPLNVVCGWLLDGSVSLRQLRIGRDAFRRLIEDVAMAEAVRHAGQVRGSRPWDYAVQCLQRLADNGVLEVDLEDVRLHLERRLAIELTANRRRARTAVRWLGQGYHPRQAMRTIIDLVCNGGVTLEYLGVSEADYRHIVTFLDPTAVVED